MQDSLSREKDRNYVSRGGFKIEHAFRDLDLSAENKNAVDIGASTGGFTDFLIKNGIKKVATVDVGYGILAWRLRNDPRVAVFERTNIRYFDIRKLPFLSDLTVVDVSFISIRTIFTKLLDLTRDNGELLILIKPQFELEKHEVEKGGIIRSRDLHIKILKRLTDFILKFKLKIEGFTFSKIKGAKGNIEFWIYIIKDFVESDSNLEKKASDYDKIIDEVVGSAHNFFK